MHIFRPNAYTYFMFFFFFQAEDGIRDYKVTGVQTCALPISRYLPRLRGRPVGGCHRADPRREFGRPEPDIGDHDPRRHGEPGDDAAPRARLRRARDRKSTRLNSSHLVISYAVFCLKKKNKDEAES